MRPSEVRNLPVTAFDPEERVVRVLGGKSAAAKRTLALVGEGFGVLACRAQEARRMGTPWLLPDPKDRYEPIGPLNKEHDAFCRDLNLTSGFTICDILLRRD